MTDMNARPPKLQALMHPYESARHSVAAVHLRDRELRYLSFGLQVSDAKFEDWIFEIASITKVFTAILLRLLVEEGKIDPQAPLRDMSDELKDAPWQEHLQTIVWVAFGNTFEGCFQIVEWIDVVDLGGFDQGCDAAPSFAALIMARKERVFAVKGDGADHVLHRVTVDLF